MSCFEGGDTLDFDQFVNLVHTTGKIEKLSQSDITRATSAYDAVAVASGIDIEGQGSVGKSSDGSAGGGTPGGVTVKRHTSTTVQPRKMLCFSCRHTFGMPPGASLISCPHCKATNQAPTAQPEDVDTTVQGERSERMQRPIMRSAAAVLASTVSP